MTDFIHPQDVDEQIVEQLMQAAEDGNLQALYDLGYLCYWGHAVALDYVRALEYFTKAAENGHADAMFSLGVMYEHGQGVPQDYVTAAEWFEKAAAIGDIHSQNVLGAYYYDGLAGEQDYAKALEWYTKAAEQGHAMAQHNLGHMYYHGQGVNKDYAEVQRWWRKAAENGLAEAQYNLGNLYMGSYGELWGAPDYKAARNWLEKAGGQGHAEAYFDMGRLYDLGLGVAVDEIKALELYLKAAELDCAEAMAKVGLLYLFGSPDVYSDYAKALKWLRGAAENGDRKSLTYLGTMYRDGKGVELDLTEAAAMFMAALNGGYAEAGRFLDEISPGLSEKQLAEARARAAAFSC